MSKHKTILDFFGKSPATKSPSNIKNEKIMSPNIAKSPASRNPNLNVKKNSNTKPNGSESSTPKSSKSAKRSIENDDDSPFSEEEKEEICTKTKRKRIFIASDSEDSADEYKPAKDEVSDDDESMPSDVSEEEERSPQPKKKKLSKSSASPASSTVDFERFKNRKSSCGSALSSPSTPKLNGTKEMSPASSKTTPVQLTPVSGKKLLNGTTPSRESDPNSEEYAKDWLHERLDWLKDPKIKDKYGHHKSHPEYDPTTLYVPDSFKKNLTPAMKQWWDLKVDHFDTILFFKVGKFYEFYHMDASIGVKECGLTYMKGDFAHSGFPEIAYGRFSEVLIEKGYKVARVEQTETPQMMEERVKKMPRPTKYDKVVAREICQKTTKGTRMLNYQDEPMADSYNYLLAITEKSNRDSETEFGICFVDTSIGKFTLSQFEDDRYGSRLLTLIAIYPPIEILYERSSLSKKTLLLLNNNLNNVSKEACSHFWDSKKTLKFLAEQDYFKKGDESVELPEAILKMLDPDDRLLQTPLKQYELALKALGACIWYLKDCCIEDNLLSMKLFEEYVPIDGPEITASPQPTFLKKHMILDGVTLRNLEIVPVRPSENPEGTLMGTLDNCSTSFGKRLLWHWLCSPLCNPDSISDRLDAVEDLIQIPEVVEEVTRRLKKIPDLERLLNKIHSQGFSRSKNHPDSRAVFYEADTYNKRKLNDFLATLCGFKESMEIMKKFESYLDDFKSSFLKSCTKPTTEGGRFPEMSEALTFFDEAFNHELAKKEGNIIPNPGVDPDYDSANSELKDLEDELESYLDEMKKKLGCRVTYVGSGRTRFQLELSDQKKVPSNFEYQGARKGFKRYYTLEGKAFLARMTAAEESREIALRDGARRIYAHFDRDYEMWKSAVHCLSVVDVLASFCLYYKNSEVSMCRPQFSLAKQETESFLEIIDGKHPTFLKYFTGDSYIPNSVYLGPKKDMKNEEINSGGKLVLVTGPNMGGKSTLMRQAGTLVLMAQVGSFVPASSMKLTPVDRIFTRVGANDNITKGESTFFVEASETSSIIHHASANSFVLVDELGRGTSTHDGTAIAYSVLKYLADKVGCRTLFSTHYHSLVEDFRSHPSVGMGHMACMVEKDSTCPELERITFLYKFIDDPCPKSYGFNVALLAGIAKDIVQIGAMKAKELEETSKLSECLRKLLIKMNSETLVSKVKAEWLQVGGSQRKMVTS